jgi:RNA polymerase sigma-70 factor, ECF subfamily
MKNNESARWAKSLWRVAIDTYSDRLHRFVLRRLGRQDADDVTQDIYENLLQIPAAEFIRDPERYIFGVANNVLCHHQQRQGKHRARVLTNSEIVEDLTEHPETLGNDQVAEAVSSAQFLEWFIHQLPPEQGAALVLYERDGRSYTEIAQRLGKSERAVERYLLKAREKLAELLHEEEFQKGTTATRRKGQ